MQIITMRPSLKLFGVESIMFWIHFAATDIGHPLVEGQMDSIKNLQIYHCLKKKEEKPQAEGFATTFMVICNLNIVGHSLSVDFKRTCMQESHSLTPFTGKIG